MILSRGDMHVQDKTGQDQEGPDAQGQPQERLSGSDRGWHGSVSIETLSQNIFVSPRIEQSRSEINRIPLSEKYTPCLELANCICYTLTGPFFQ